MSKHFEQDNLGDIGNPKYDHFYENVPPGGKLRIQVYWTLPAIADAAAFWNSLKLIQNAAKTLRRYRMDIDFEPVSAGSSAIMIQARAREIVSKELAQSIKTRDVFGVAAGTLFSVSGAFPLSVLERVRSNIPPVAGVVDYNNYVDANGAGKSADHLRLAVRDIIGRSVNERRCVVIFSVRGSGKPGGVGEAVLTPAYLPWVFADANHMASPDHLLHELGHACGLGHQADGALNVMSEDNWYEGEPKATLYGWQAETIYQSYYCSGPNPPTEWWDGSTLNRKHFAWKSLELQSN